MTLSQALRIPCCHFHTQASPLEPRLISEAVTVSRRMALMLRRDQKRTPELSIPCDLRAETHVRKTNRACRERSWLQEDSWVPDSPQWISPIAVRANPQPERRGISFHPAQGASHHGRDDQGVSG